MVPVKRAKLEKATVAVRTAHLLRINSYMDVAIISMWMQSPRAAVAMGMAGASIKGDGPDGADAEILERLRGLVGEARKHYANDDFPAAMTRMRVAHDQLALWIIGLSGE